MIYTYPRENSEPIQVAKPLLLPDATKLAQVFDRIVPYDVSDNLENVKRGKGRVSGIEPVILPFEDYKPGTKSRKGRKVQGRCSLGPYCRINRRGGEFDTWDVVPTVQVIEAVRSNMLLATGPITYQITERDDGWLVTAQYETIIGSAYLAMLDKGAM